ncbi:hypothetical protein KDK95_20505 [Actinospica sp. MGRD01-02]|uniref:Uncharacterized protein n=1 Tax=Actinospica acidithermotolerans TaxID=2828514 RepID=A0A941IK95_9ACTN|nr:hypothetical protein [Actinospica acidithermotolerans]MBR7828702.1 hypothetical protein [Actinospica acidithermotolerans]
MMVNVRPGESGNIRVVAGSWWEQDHGQGDLAVYLNRPEPGQVLTIGDLCAGLSEADERMLVAVHEVGHVAAIHGLGLDFGGTQIYPKDPEAIGTQGIVTQLGRTEFLEPAAVSAVQSATVSLSAWMAAELWLSVEGKESQFHSWFVQSHAAHDHHVLLNRPTSELAAFLYGVAVAPRGWDGAVLSVDALTEQVRGALQSRWDELRALAEIVDTDGSADHEQIMESLGEPGWIGWA